MSVYKSPRSPEFVIQALVPGRQYAPVQSWAAAEGTPAYYGCCGRIIRPQSAAGLEAAASPLLREKSLGLEADKVRLFCHLS